MELPAARTLLTVAGAGHIALAAGSLLIPRLLSWKQNLESLPPLFRQMFWVYAGYTLCTNLFFGFLSIFGRDELIRGSFLSTAISGFIALYWIARVIIQFTYFDRRSAPGEFIYKAGEVSLNSLFIFFSVLYSWIFIINLQQPL